MFSTSLWCVIESRRALGETRDVCCEIRNMRSRKSRLKKTAGRSRRSRYAAADCRNTLSTRTRSRTLSPLTGSGPSTAPWPSTSSSGNAKMSCTSFLPVYGPAGSLILIFTPSLQPGVLPQLGLGVAACRVLAEGRRRRTLRTASALVLLLSRPCTDLRGMISRWYRRTQRVSALPSREYSRERLHQRPLCETCLGAAECSGRRSC